MKELSDKTIEDLFNDKTEYGTLLKRYIKNVYVSNSNRQLLIPKEIVDSFGKSLVFDIYEDKVILYSTSKLGIKFK